MAKKNPEKKAQTRKAIIDAFWQIYTANPSKTVTVSAVVEKAHIHRSTFYEYFRDTADVLNAIEESLINIIKHEAVESVRLRNEADPVGVVNRVYGNYSDKLTVLLGPQGDPYFVRKIKDEVKPAVAEIVGIQGNEGTNAYLLEFVSSGILSTISLWYERGCDVESDELESTIRTLLTQGINAL